MTINVLHIWGPGFKNDFGGQYIFWKYAYENWNENSVCHKILDYDDKSIKDARLLIRESSVLPKEYPSRLKRFLWAINLLWLITVYQNKYDVLHVHMLLWGGLLVAPWAKLIGKPAIYESVLEGSDNPSSIQKVKFGNVMLWCLRHFTKVIAISGALAKDFKAYEIPVVTISNSVDTFMFSPVKNSSEKMGLRKDFEISEDAQVLLFVGSVKHRKGVDILVEMFVRMAGKRPNLFLLIIGPKTIKENKSIDMEYVQGLYSVLQSKQLLERVKFVGMVKDKNRLAKFYKLADVFVFPTRQEGLGNVVLEAAASQLPVVVTHLPEIEDIIQDKINGLFIPRDDVDACEKAVSLFLDDFSFARAMSINAREYVIQKFAYKNWQSDVRQCYIDTLK